MELPTASTISLASQGQERSTIVRLSIFWRIVLTSLVIIVVMELNALGLLPWMARSVKVSPAVPPTSGEVSV